MCRHCHLQLALEMVSNLQNDCLLQDLQHISNIIKMLQSKVYDIMKRITNLTLQSINLHMHIRKQYLFAAVPLRSWSTDCCNPNISLGYCQTNPQSTYIPFILLTLSLATQSNYDWLMKF